MHIVQQAKDKAALLHDGSGHSQQIDSQDASQEDQILLDFHQAKAEPATDL